MYFQRQPPFYIVNYLVGNFSENVEVQNKNLN